MNTNSTDFFGKENIWKILWRLAPPVMLAQLIQALYNITDSFFVGRYSEDGLTALSIIYPLQLLMIALAVGTGVGINTSMARLYGRHNMQKADEVAGTGTPLALVLWAVFAAVCWFFMPTYAHLSTGSQSVAELVIVYGRIVCVCSVGLFCESVWTKIHQAAGNMRRPMVAQIIGAVINISFDWILIFGYCGFPELGLTGAAIATVIGQCVAAVIVFFGAQRPSPAKAAYPAIVQQIFKDGFPNILMQSAYTFYIFGLNLILATFSDQAVTALGLYYKWQTFFFIPLGGLQTCIVPIISYNYAAKNVARCKKTLWNSFLFGTAFMLLGVCCFEIMPGTLLRLFSGDAEVISVGTHAFRIIGVSFIPMVPSLIYPVFFQALGRQAESVALTVVRTVILFVPLGWLFSRFGLDWFWFTYPVTEILTSAVGLFCYRRFCTAPALI